MKMPENGYGFFTKKLPRPGDKPPRGRSAAMYAYNAWKRWAIDNAYQWRRWASDIFASLTLGELWTQNGTVAPPLVLSCAGQVCSNGTCPACSVSPAEMTENIRANLQRHNQTKSCSLCGERSSLLLGSPMPCCWACSDQAEGLGLFAPHKLKCHGVGGLPCPHGGSRDGTHLLRRRCLGEQACKRPGGMVCPYEGLREGTPGVQVRGPSRVGSLHIGLLTSDARRPRLPLGRAHHARRIPRAFTYVLRCRDHGHSCGSGTGLTKPLVAPPAWAGPLYVP